MPRSDFQRFVRIWLLVIFSAAFLMTIIALGAYLNGSGHHLGVAYVLARTLWGAGGGIILGAIIAAVITYS